MFSDAQIIFPSDDDKIENYFFPQMYQILPLRCQWKIDLHFLLNFTFS